MSDRGKPLSTAPSLKNNYKVNPAKPTKPVKPIPNLSNFKKKDFLVADSIKTLDAANLPQILFSKSSFDSRSLEQNNSDTMVNLTPSEIRRLGARFKKLDSDNSGTLSLKEFLKIPEISHNVFAHRIVELFDADGNGEVDFGEFVLSMSQFSILGNLEGRLRCAFRIYDIDNDGFISNGELFQVIKGMVGSNMTGIQVQQIVDHTFMVGDVDQDGQISFEEFSALVDNNPSIRTDTFLRGGL